MRIVWIGLVALLTACDAPDGTGSAAGAEGSISRAASAEPIRLRFAPPEGTEFVETVFKRSKRDCEALPSTLLETEEKIAVKIQRSESGYVMTTKHLSVRSWHNGDGYNDPYLAHLVGKDLTHRIDAGGRLLAVDGLSGLASETRTTLGANQLPFGIVVSDQDVFAGVEWQWNRRVGALAGSSIAIGSTVETMSSLPLPGGRSISLPEKISVLRLVSCTGGRCALVLRDSKSNDAALAEFVVEMVRNDPAMRRFAVKELPKPIGSEITVSADLVIDPDTMLIYQDTGSQVTSFTMDLPGYGSASFTTRAEWRHTFDYPTASRGEAR